MGTLGSLGYEAATPIQREAIPVLLRGRDLVAQAATGTGKTAAFALPLLTRVADREPGPDPIALVLVPTRELCIQVSEATHRYGRDLGARTLPIYGGQHISHQLRELRRGVDVVVATPGRVRDHLARGTISLDRIEVVVLDEADEMLDMGFAEEIEEILQSTPSHRQTAMLSATMPPRLQGISRRHLHDPVTLEIERPVPTQQDQAHVRQTAYLVDRAHKPAALGRILDMEDPTAALVFCRTREEVDRLSEAINGRGYRAAALHGGMDQGQRDRVMGQLRSGTVDLLVATDVAARGLDVDRLTHVVNYNVPSAPEAYVHRTGRVGRGGRSGVAITLAEPREHRMLKTIGRVTKQRIAIEKLPTSADLRAKQLELTRAALGEMLVSDDLDSYRVVVESLTDEFDLMQVALAAVRLAHESTTTGAEEEDIPEPTLRRQDARRPTQPGKDRPPRRRSSGDDVARLFVGAGRAAGIRPQDLVGAIANETDLRGRDIGAIEITDRFSLVEVPKGSVDQVLSALRTSRLKGRKVQVRLDRKGPR